ncbi:hypothetical protein PR202_ga30000 [Eleusine coracana subsp. coracana]|uniref:KIB1-4 beta-propeller domain-containing protein n=1 Tax=Eleusine coracana subsp. coracana TaxID=191504 RepID=A0AAV5DN46_ELECO|nr:hypothetical protein PR202_ga30000 [Eleusine coracana subsp. coracana]
MEGCSRRADNRSSLWGLSIQSKDLLRLVFRVLSKLLLGICPDLLKKFQIDECVGTPAIESQIVVATLQELPQDVLAVIFANLEIPDLVRAGSYIVVIIHNPYGQLSFARTGDYKWTWLPPNAGYRDCICMDGLLYALTSVGEIDAFDLAGPTVTRKVIMDKVKDNVYESMYLIPAPWGDLLQVWRIVDNPNHVHMDGDDDDAPAIVNAPQQENTLN